MYLAGCGKTRPSATRTDFLRLDSGKSPENIGSGEILHASSEVLVGTFSATC